MGDLLQTGRRRAARVARAGRRGLERHRPRRRRGRDALGLRSAPGPRSRARPASCTTPGSSSLDPPDAHGRAQRRRRPRLPLECRARRLCRVAIASPSPASATSASPGTTLTGPVDYVLVVASRGRCDVNGDAFVDKPDVDAIFAARGQLASGPSDPRDNDGNGVIDVLDSRACALQCGRPTLPATGRRRLLRAARAGAAAAAVDRSSLAQEEVVMRWLAVLLLSCVVNLLPKDAAAVSISLLPSQPFGERGRLAHAGARGGRAGGRGGGRLRRDRAFSAPHSPSWTPLRRRARRRRSRRGRARASRAVRGA